MIIFKKRCGKRINPLVCANEEYVSDATETIVKDISTNDKEDTYVCRNSKYDLKNFSDKDAASIDQDVIRKSSRTKKKNKLLSGSKLLSSRDYSFHACSPIKEKRQRISESDDSDDGDAYDNTDYVMQEKKRRISESDYDDDCQNDDNANTDHVQSSIPGKKRRISESDYYDDDCHNDDNANTDHVQSSIPVKIQRISENVTNGLKSIKMNNWQHFPSQIPSTDKKKYPQKPCVTCRRHGVRHDTRYYCNFCNVALCKDPCFREYHSV